ncbi:MAG: hypothetical protein ACI4Q6_00500 [Huintestinicola sp.]
MEAMNGRIVRSIAGHDKGRFLAVVGTEDDFVFLADGKERKLDAPKKKRLKHIAPTNTVIDTASLTDKQLRSVLARFKEN